MPNNQKYYHICIDPKSYNLTKLKKYNFVKITDSKVLIENDKGLKKSYSYDLFKRVRVIQPDEVRKDTKLVYVGGISKLVGTISNNAKVIGSQIIAGKTIRLPVNSKVNSAKDIGTTFVSLYDLYNEVGDTIFSVVSPDLSINKDYASKEDIIKKLVLGQLLSYNGNIYKITNLRGKYTVRLQNAHTGEEKEYQKPELKNKCYKLS